MQKFFPGRSIVFSWWLPICAMCLQTPVFAAPVARALHKAQGELASASACQSRASELYSLSERMRHYGVPGVSVAVIVDYRIPWAQGFGEAEAGSGRRVDTGTVFSVGSVSKLGTAATALRLQSVQRIALDLDINVLLDRWQIPVSPFSTDEVVTIRRILSHTAGLSVHGFPDFDPGSAFPDSLETVKGQPPAVTDPVQVLQTPGSGFLYSGGGTTVLQLAIEDIEDKPFHEVAAKTVLEPLGMDRSTYLNPLPESHGNIAHAWPAHSPSPRMAYVRRRGGLRIVDHGHRRRPATDRICGQLPRDR